MDKLEPGALLYNRYRISQSLGKGGMGMVYLAEDISLNRSVAVKENYGIGEDSTEQFLQEARILAELHHPNLPRVTDYFIVGPLQYLVMDFLSGDDLQIVLEREGRQPVDKVMYWAKHLVDALTYMHKQNPPVIHRDIKPANIRLRNDGTAVLVDFGIAKVAESSQKTNAGAIGYTPGFAPPEQVGGGRTGPFTDQYSLAATIYTLLTGTRPVDSVKRILEGASVEDARVLNQEIPENVSMALEKAMALHPDDRFENVQSFYSALVNLEFRSPENNFEPQPQSNLNKTRPAWMMAAFGLIGLLVVAILGVAVIAAYGLIKPVNPIPSTTTQTVTELIIPSASKVDATNATPTSIQNPVVATEITPTKNVGDSAGQPAPNKLVSGKWIAYSSDYADGSTLQIWLMNVGLNNEGKPVALQQKQLTGSPGNKTQTAWSPDGKFLLFSAPSLDKANGLDIWRISVEGVEEVDLSNRKGDDLYAAWSPDGNLINFTNKGREDGIQQLYLMDSNGNNQQDISTDYDESQGTWSLDRKALLYVIRTNNISYFSLRLSGGEYKTAQPFDNNQVYGRLGQVTDPAFSPDGSLLAYTRSKGRDRRIGVVEYLSKGANFNLLANTGKDYDPAWSPDGKWIVFTSERDSNPEIYIMSSAGLIQTNVSKSPSRDSFPAWQP